MKPIHLGIRALCAFLLTSFLSVSQAYGQKELKVGEVLPALLLGKGYNFHQTVKTSQFKGKFIILDFWNVGCTSCIKAFPELDSLQVKFQGQLQIIGITQNSKEQVDRLFAKIKVRPPRFPLVTSDKQFNALFPHVGEPYQVWVDNKGVIRYITAGYNATENHIQDFMDGKRLDMYNPVELEDFSDEKPLIGEAATRLSPFVQYYSVLLQGIEDFTYHFRRSNKVQIDRDSSSNQPYYIKAMNASILMLYNIAFNEDVFGYEISATNLFQNNRVVFETKDSLNFFVPTDPDQIDEWRRKNLFSYELKVPQQKAKECFKIMQQELNHYFNYIATVENRKTKCLVLVKKGVEDLLATKHGQSAPSYSFSNNHFIFNNQPFYPFFVRNLVYFYQTMKEPIIDDTGYRGAVDFDLNGDIGDLPSLKKELQRYGLDLVVEEHEIPMLVIRDKH